MAERFNRKPLLVSIGLYIAACALPALILHTKHFLNHTLSQWGGYRSINGVTLLFTGLVFGWVKLNFTAFANVPLWLSWICFFRGNLAAARKASLVALLLSIETLQLLIQPYMFDESGTAQGYLAAPHIGFLCWIASMLVIWWSSRRDRVTSQD